MKRTIKYWLIYPLLLFLVACSATSVPEPEEAESVAALPTPTEIPATNTPKPSATPSATIAEPTATQTAEPSATATATSEPTATHTPEVSDQCLDCHIDKQRLIDTAKPEEVIPSESSGVG